MSEIGDHHVSSDENQVTIVQEKWLNGSSKKFVKRLVKIEKSLIQKEHLHVSTEPTRVLCVQNAGLGNDVSQDEVLPLFARHGKVDGIVMVPRKPYCFVCYGDHHGATAAYQNLNGFVLRGGQEPSQSVILYLFYVDRAPSSVMPSQETPPGLIVLEDYVTEDEEMVLLNFVETKLSQTERGQMKHRQVLHFGFEFKYGINDVDVNDPLQEVIPEVCHKFLSQTVERGHIKFFPDQLTINQYRAGQGIPPHVDTPAAFEDDIMSLSLGSQAVMDFRHPDGRHLSVLLPRRSLLVMTGESRYIWSHGITPRKSDIVASLDSTGLTLLHRSTRTSFTFRKVVRERSDQKKSVHGILMPNNDAEAAALERDHVQQVYDDIASHFSGTRYKAWPHVMEFIKEQPDYSLLADVGCGNGKCLGANTTLYEIGCDFSKNLVAICHSRGFETCVSDVTYLPHRTSSMDIVLCIAVIHHLATKERRLKAVLEVVRILRPGGKALIYVWAMEQDFGQKPSKYINVNRQKHLLGEGGDATVSKESRDGEKSTMSVSYDNVQGREFSDTVSGSTECDSCIAKQERLSSDGASVDVLSECVENVAARTKQPFQVNQIPVRRKENSIATSATEASDKNTCLRTEETKAPAKLHVHVNRTQFKEQDMLVPWQLKGSAAPQAKESPQTFHRFYHMFRQGELEALCKHVPDCSVIRSYHDQGNWCVVLEKGSLIT